MSRTDARTISLRHRPARTIPATVVALVLLALGVGLVWTSVLRLVDGTWPAAASQTAAWIAALTWGSVTLLLIALAVAVFGLILVIAALKPGAPSAHRMQAVAVPSGASTEVVMTRGAIAKLATARAANVDGVDGASASVGGRKVAVTVKTASAERQDVEQRVHQQVLAALQSAGLDPVPTLAVTARTQRP